MKVWGKRDTNNDDAEWLKKADHGSHRGNSTRLPFSRNACQKPVVNVLNSKLNVEAFEFVPTFSPKQNEILSNFCDETTRLFGRSLFDLIDLSANWSAKPDVEKKAVIISLLCQQ